MKTTSKFPMPSCVAPRRWRPSAGFLFERSSPEALSDKLRAQGDRDSKPGMRTFGKTPSPAPGNGQNESHHRGKSSTRSRLGINSDPGQTALAFAEKRRSFASRSDRHSGAAF